MRACVRTCCCLALVLLLLSGAGAATINVPADYGTIQGAIDAAVAGDVIIVQPGTYNEDIDFNGKAITLQSTNPLDPAVVEATIIQSTGGSSAVTFEGGETATSIIEGFTITEGDANIGDGGGIYCNGTSPIIRNNVISRNGPDTFGYGGGMACVNGAAPQITDNIFSYNAASYGGAIYIYSTAPAPGARAVTSGPVITGNTFYGNVASSGGAIYCDEGEFTANNNQFGLGNDTNPALTAAASAVKAKVAAARSERATSASKDKPAARAPKAPRRHVPRELRQPTLIQARAVPQYGGNGAYSGGAIHLRYSSADLTGNTFINNGVDAYGGAIYMEYAGTLTCQDNVFDRNLARYDGSSAGDGGAVYADGSGGEQPELTFDGDRFIGNVAYDGPGVYCNECSADFSDCEFDSNSCVSEGMAVYATGDGAAQTHLTFTGCTFTHNAGEGGVLSLNGPGEGDNTSATASFEGCSFDNNSFHDYPGCLYIQSATISANNCSFSNNFTDYYGGGVSLQNVSVGTVSNCTFSYNTADQYGGAVYVSSSKLHLTNSTFTGNSSNYSSGYGGAIYLDMDDSNPSTIPAEGEERDDITYIEDCTFTRNTGAYDGGAIYAETGYAEVRRCRFTENAAFESGGAVYWNSSDASVFEQNLFEGNTATSSGGAIYYSTASSANLCRNNTFRGSLASSYVGQGGAIWVAADSDIYNNVFCSNWAGENGGGLYTPGDYNVNLYNNSFARNAARRGGGIYHSGGSNTVTTNNIVAFSENGGGIYSTGGGSTWQYNDVYGNKGGNWPGDMGDQTGLNGNISVDPQFADVANCDLHLKSIAGRWDPDTETWAQDYVTSKCIDAGEPVVSVFATSDFDNEPEPNGDRVNLGAYGNTAQASKTSMLQSITFAAGTGGVSRIGPITFTFMQQVVQGSAETRLSFAPQVDPDLTWPTPWKMVATLPVIGSMDANTNYLANFAADVRRRSDNYLYPAESIPFLTGKEPLVYDVYPADGATGVAVDTAIELEFTEPMHRPSVERNFSLVSAPVAPGASAKSVAGTFSWSADGTQVEFTPATPLTADASYVVNLAKAARSKAGYTLAKAFRSEFDTGSGPTNPALAMTAAAASTRGGGSQITVSLSAAATVSASIRNLAGVEIAVIPAQDLEKGVSTLLWDGKSRSGTATPAGRYLVTLTAAAEDGSQTTALTALQK